MEICQQIGLVLLVSLMVFVFYNDIARILTQG
jgi:membrane-associated protease RseP (regulator of RpoE activity)